MDNSSDDIGKQLINELLLDPGRFAEEGKGYQLLQAYFRGFSVETLRPLLRNDNFWIQSESMAIVNELGISASSLIHDVVPLLKVNDRSIQYDALESILVCSFGRNVGEFKHIVHAMEADDEVIRVLAMRLASNADKDQLETAYGQSESGILCEEHKNGLAFLLEGERVEPEMVDEMVKDICALKRKYGAIAAKRLFKKYPLLINKGLSSFDPDIRKFCQDFVDLSQS